MIIYTYLNQNQLHANNDELKTIDHYYVTLLQCAVAIESTTLINILTAHNVNINPTNKL